MTDQFSTKTGKVSFWMPSEVQVFLDVAPSFFRAKFHVLLRKFANCEL